MKREKRDGVYVQRGYLYIGIPVPDPKRPGKFKPKLMSTGLRPGQEKQARELRRRTIDRLNANAEQGVTDGPITFSKFRARVIENRKHHSTWGDDEARLENHVEPCLVPAGKEGKLRPFGELPLEDIRTRHIIAVFEPMLGAVDRGEIAPSTVHNIYSNVRTVFKQAVARDLISHNPCQLLREQLPENVDADDEWRSEAIFTRRELKRLLGDDLVPSHRRVFYALEFLGAMRFGEAAAVQWRDVRRRLKPLGKLTISKSQKKGNRLGRTKTKRAREMPIHPTLRRILKWWQLEGWEQAMGRKPTDEDYVVPVIADPQTAAANHGRGRRLEAGGRQTHSFYWKRWVKDLKVLGMRHRRGHDLRASFITYAVEDGAQWVILEHCTHTPGKGKAIAGYMRFPWKARCAEVAKLRFKLPSVAPKLALVEAEPLAAAGAEGSFPVQPESFDPNEFGGLVSRSDESFSHFSADRQIPSKFSHLQMEAAGIEAAYQGGSSGAEHGPTGGVSVRLVSVGPTEEESSVSLRSPAQPDSAEKLKRVRKELADVLANIGSGSSSVQTSRRRTAEALKAILPRLPEHARPSIELALEAIELAEKGGESPSRVLRFLLQSCLRRLGTGSRWDGSSKSKALRALLRDGEWHTSSELAQVAGAGRQTTDALRRVREGLDGEPAWIIETEQVAGRVHRFRFIQVRGGVR